jgi:HSP20 family molecular chaperone IbpA
VAVPGKIDLNKEPTAEVKDGVLTVTFEKSEVSKPKKLKVTAK